MADSIHNMLEPNSSGTVGAGVEILTPPTLIDLKAGNEVAEKIRELNSIVLPTVPNKWVHQASADAIWIGPNHWLIRLPESRGQAMLKQLQKLIPASVGAATDVSAAYTGVTVRRDHAIALLSQGCPLDFFLMNNGDCAQSILARTSVLILCTEKQFEVWFEQSYTNYMLRWLNSRIAQ